MNQSMRKISASALLVIGMIAWFSLLPGCHSHTYRVVFEEVDGDRKLSPGSIAVIAGNGTEFDVRLAQAVAEKIAQKTVLTVLPQREVSRAIPGYPVEVMEQFDKREEKHQDPRVLFPEEKGRVSALQSRLKTDYLFAVWGTQMEKVRIIRVPTGFVNYSYRGNIHARLIDARSGDVLGFVRYRSDNFVDRETANYARAKSGEDVFLEQLAENSAERIVSRFVKGYGKNLAK